MAVKLPGPRADARVHLRLGATDMRKSIDGLSALTAGELNLDPYSGDVFGFCNRRRDTAKFIFWERNGFCIWHKRLEKDRFPWPDSKTEALELSPTQLEWLLDGIDFRRAHRLIKYSTII